MSRIHVREFTDDAGVKLEVDCVIRCEGRGLGFYVEEYAAWRWDDRNDTTAPHVTLSDAEFDRLNEEVCGDSSLYDDDR